jgi:hypothetical protein
VAYTNFVVGGLPYGLSGRDRCARKKRSPRIITGVANSRRRPPPINGCDTLDTQVISPRRVWELGHGRCKQGNNGWRDLAKNWALKHGFLHACKRRQKQRLRTIRPTWSRTDDWRPSR